MSPSIGFTDSRPLIPTWQPEVLRVEGVPIYAATHYYDGDNREIAKRMKTGDRHAIETAAKAMIPLIPRDSILVPIPGHEGKATHTLELCRVISSRTGLQIADVLQGNSRESNYAAKHSGKGLTEKDMGFRATSLLPDGKKPVYIDNVVDTGTTAKAAYQAIGNGFVVTFAISDTLFQQQKVSHGIHR